MQRAAPVMLVGAFAFAWWLLRAEAPATGRFPEIAAAMASVPYSIGRWHGVDVALPAAATEILRPTAVLSRRYGELGGDRSAILGIVHCGDVRDMLGHHPPRCYPAAGWIPREGGSEPIRLQLDGRTVEGVVHRFHRSEAQGLRAEKSVVGLFLLPDGAAGGDESLLGERAPKRLLSERGVAQLQVVVEGWPSGAEIAERAQVLLDGLPRTLLMALQSGRGRHDDADAPDHPTSVDALEPVRTTEGDR